MVLGLVATVTACTSSPDRLEEVPEGPSIDQHGVSFIFDQEPTYGSFANGDYWVLGPVTLIGMTPQFHGEHHGWEVNPADEEAQGFETRIASFDASRVPAFPFTAEPGQSIVKAVSLAPLDDDECRPCLQTAAVLTVVSEPPPDEGATVFRPPYFGADKPYYSTDELRTELLPTLPAPASANTLGDVADQFARVQLDHKVNWTGRPMHPSDNMPDYGSSIAVRTANAALRLMLDDSVEDKMPALIGYVQAGIDLHHMALGGVYWPPGGGHGEGRKLPVAMAAVLLDDPAMQSALSSADRGTYGENGGMYYSAAADAVLFGQTPNSEENYWTNLVFDTGSRTIIDPYEMIDGGHIPGGSYQFCCTAQPWKLTATAVRLMPELEQIWNHPEFFTYVDRWVSFGAWSQPDTCAPPTGVCAGGLNSGAACTTASAPEICTGEDASCDTTGSWDTEYGVTYGPDGAGGCIADTDPSDGIGRFPLRHGINADGGHYGSAFADEMWDAHVATP
jgi:hypothetical protein